MRRTSNLVFAAVAVTVFAGTALGQPAAPRKETVQFAHGASEATIKSSVQGGQDVDYVVRASAGQTLTVTLRKTNGSNYFNVLPPGSNDVAMFVGQDGSNFKGMLPDDGDYVVRVYLMRSAARRNEKSDYTLTIGVTGKPLAPLAASKDALVSGSRFHATGTIPCTPPFAVAPGQCEASVVRRGSDGTGTVELRVKGQRDAIRRILFVAGKPVAADAPEPITFSRQGDDTLIRIGSDERYTIPDALVLGG
jgi:hypothetical protein